MLNLARLCEAGNGRKTYVRSVETLVVATHAPFSLHICNRVGQRVRSARVDPHDRHALCVAVEVFAAINEPLGVSRFGCAGRAQQKQMEAQDRRHPTSHHCTHYDKIRRWFRHNQRSQNFSQHSLVSTSPARTIATLFTSHDLADVSNYVWCTVVDTKSHPRLRGQLRHTCTLFHTFGF